MATESVERDRDESTGASGEAAVVGPRDARLEEVPAEPTGQLRRLPVRAIRVPEERARADAGDVAALAASLSEVGMLQPVLVDAQGTLVAGLRRLRAAEQLGWTEVPVLELGPLDVIERKLVELAENVERADLSPLEETLALGRLVRSVRQVVAQVADGDPGVLRQIAAKMPSTAKLLSGDAPRRRGRPPRPGSLRALGCY